jgi:aryl-alcohol dehydrogenase-like predicted oxidoreductase
MKYNRLGTSGLFVSELSFGTMTFGQVEGQSFGGLTQKDARSASENSSPVSVNSLETK